jgi:hypothetical protein
LHDSSLLNFMTVKIWGYIGVTKSYVNVNVENNSIIVNLYKELLVPFKKIIKFYSDFVPL